MILSAHRLTNACRVLPRLLRIHVMRCGGLFLLVGCVLSGCQTHSLSEEEMRARLVASGIAWDEPIVNAEGEFVLDMSRNHVTDISFLKGLPLTELNLFGTPVSDLSPLHGMPLRVLFLNRTRVRDLSPLKGLPLELLVITETPVEDIFPLRGMSLKWLFYDTNRVVRGIEVLKNMESLETINGRPAREAISERSE